MKRHVRPTTLLVALVAMIACARVEERAPRARLDALVASGRIHAPIELQPKEVLAIYDLAMAADDGLYSSFNLSIDARPTGYSVLLDPGWGPASGYELIIDVTKDGLELARSHPIACFYAE